MQQNVLEDKSSMLISLGDIGTTRSWNYTEPTLLIPGRFTSRSSITLSSFTQKFFEQYPILKGMNWSNLALRGGAIIDILLGRDPNDLDFFFYGLETEELLLDRANEIIKYLLEKEREYVDDYNQNIKKRIAENVDHYHHHRAQPKDISIKAVRRGSVISIALSAIKVPIQIVLCMHESLEIMTKVSDFAICGIVFDGQSVLLPPDAKFELENTAIVVNNRNGAGYPLHKRIEKYFNKGFDMIFPQLDVEKMPKGYLQFGLKDAIQTPSIAFVYNQIEGNKIHFHSFITPKDDSRDDVLLPKGYEAAGDMDSRSILFDNIAVLASIILQRKRKQTGIEYDKEEDLVKRFSVFAEGDFATHVLNALPDITDRQVGNTYPAISGQVFSDGRISFQPYNKYVTIESLSNVLSQIAERSTKDNVSVGKACEDIIKDVINRQIEASNELCLMLKNEFQGKRPVVIKSDDFFAHMTKDAAVFYGTYLKSSN